MKKYALIAVLFVATVTAAQDDMQDGRDHPELPRIDGTVIRGYMSSDYDEGQFITAFADKELATETAAGERTRVFYLAPTSVSIPQIFRNYEVALGGLGEIDEMYRCAADCARNLGRAFVWQDSNRIPTDVYMSQFIYATFGYENQAYRYWVVTSADARYHVSVYTAYLNGLQAKKVKDTRSIHLDIVEEADFKPTLTFVSADEIVEGISEDGRIALYGIQFDFDSAAIKPESAATLTEIAKALRNDSSLNLFVVGHTDNQGTYDYNLDLSNRRAASVVTALTGDYAVSADRLIAVGVGPVAPLASNGTEAGQAVNRRVELVQQ